MQRQLLPGLSREEARLSSLRSVWVSQAGNRGALCGRWLCHSPDERCWRCDCRSGSPLAQTLRVTVWTAQARGSPSLLSVLFARGAALPVLLEARTFGGCYSIDRALPRDACLLLVGFLAVLPPSLAGFSIWCVAAILAGPSTGRKFMKTNAVIKLLESAHLASRHHVASC